MKFWLLAFIVIYASAGNAEDFQNGFYQVTGGENCSEILGSLKYLNAESSIEADNCQYKFLNNNIQTVGICTRLIAHRGDTRYYPANTVSAFDTALSQGYKGIELDIWLSKDNKAMVSHDNNLWAATNCKGKITETNSEEILKNCSVIQSAIIPEKRLLSKKSIEARPMPTLKEVFTSFLAEDKRAEQIIVDIKFLEGRTNLIESLADAIPNCSAEECIDYQKRITFISQDQEDVKRLRAAYPFSHVAYESDRTISGLIDENNLDLWSEGNNFDTISLNFNSLYDLKFKILKFLMGQNIQPKKRFKILYNTNIETGHPKRLLGWSISNKKGIRGLKDFNIQDALTDLPFGEVMNTLLDDTSEDELITNLELIKNNKTRCEL